MNHTLLINIVLVALQTDKLDNTMPEGPLEAPFVGVSKETSGRGVCDVWSTPRSAELIQIQSPFTDFEDATFTEI